VATLTAAREPGLTSCGRRIECFSFADGHGLVRMEITLPDGFPEERRLGVERYALAAVTAMTDKIGRDE
jgi:hypothetical protein